MIVRPESNNEQAEDIANAYAKAITGTGGSVTRRENWGRRPLAYPINRSSHGTYFLFNFSCPQAASRDLLAKISAQEEYDENVIRTLLLRTKRPPQGPSPIMESASDDKSEDGAANNQ